MADTTVQKVDESLILHLLALIREKGPISLWSLLPLQDHTLKEFHEVTTIMKSRRIVSESEGKMSITEEGIKLLPDINRTTMSLDFACKECGTRGYFVDSKDELLTKFKEAVKTRPLPSEEFDQTAVSDEDTFIRVAFMHERGDVYQKNLMMIGDFDCFGLMAALSGLPNKVVVLEYDTRLVNFINETAKKYNIEHILSARVFDVREPLPAEFEKNFDVFSCDPVETYEGIKLYFSRGTQTLKGVGSSAYFGLTSLEAGRYKWFQIEKLLIGMNFVITDARRNFNCYPDTGLELMHPFYKKVGVAPDCTWYWASLFRIECVEDPIIPIVGKYEGTQDIYVDDEAWATPQKD